MKINFNTTDLNLSNLKGYVGKESIASAKERQEMNRTKLLRGHMRSVKRRVVYLIFLIVALWFISGWRRFLRFTTESKRL